MWERHANQTQVCVRRTWEWGGIPRRRCVLAGRNLRRALLFKRAKLLLLCSTKQSRNRGAREASLCTPGENVYSSFKSAVRLCVIDPAMLVWTICRLTSLISSLQKVKQSLYRNTCFFTGRRRKGTFFQRYLRSCPSCTALGRVPVHVSITEGSRRSYLQDAGMIFFGSSSEKKVALLMQRVNSSSDSVRPRQIKDLFARHTCPPIWNGRGG